MTFENVAFYSTNVGAGTSPHGEAYIHTSGIVFVEVWNNSGTFNNCSFANAVIAIRGRKSSSSTVIPKTITVNRCSFIECKMPIQGYCEKVLVNNSSFANYGDLYSGDHCIYIERYGCKSLKISNCVVETLHSESGAAFQIYGTPKAGDALPELSVQGCLIDGNGILSASGAKATIKDCVFNEQSSEQFIAWIESGSLILRDSEINHSYAFSYANSTAKVYALNCTFRLMTDLGRVRCNFPLVSSNCTYVDWGGNVRVDGTQFLGCTFTRIGTHTLNGLYISNNNGYSIILRNTRFQNGDKITNNENAIKEYSNCSQF